MQQKKPEGMSQEELQYRMMLQEAILWASSQVLKEQEAEVKRRALERVKALQELRK